MQVRTTWQPSQGKMSQAKPSTALICQMAATRGTRALVVAANGQICWAAMMNAGCMILLRLTLQEAAWQP